ncbi:hypothetical protein LZ554_007451 [Drepanopeziza brunnea f. sp. 'monogermtubi']|nr:hypothetical protein LZ554_007451 [Drepanopeziza brunnea f. sp. 'monogermtubi']
MEILSPLSSSSVTRSALLIFSTASHLFESTIPLPSRLHISRHPSSPKPSLKKPLPQSAPSPLALFHNRPRNQRRRARRNFTTLNFRTKAARVQEPSSQARTAGTPIQGLRSRRACYLRIEGPSGCERELCSGLDACG